MCPYMFFVYILWGLLCLYIFKCFAHSPSEKVWTKSIALGCVFICAYIYFVRSIVLECVHMLLIGFAHSSSGKVRTKSVVLGCVSWQFVRNCYTLETHQIERLGFLGISRYKVKLRFEFVPVNSSFRIWWISEVLQFQWILSYRVV